MVEIEISGGDVKKQVSDLLYVAEAVVTGFETKIQPIIDVSKERQNIAVSHGSSGIAYTTPTDKDFFLTELHIIVSNEEGGLAGHTINTIDFTPVGQAQVSINTPCVQNSGQVGSNAIQKITFKDGIKLARGTAVRFTLGADVGNATIVGFVKESYIAGA